MILRGEKGTSCWDTALWVNLRNLLNEVGPVKRPELVNQVHFITCGQHRVASVCELAYCHFLIPLTDESSLCRRNSPAAGEEGYSGL